MALFFKDTVFVKDNCDLENEISELEHLRGKVTNEDELDKYIKTLKAGLSGEKAIEYELKNARIGLYVLHDLNIEFEGNNAQIDYVIVSPVHIYLVECKNMIGDITVDNNGQFIRKLPWGKKESIYLPLMQANRHVDILKKIRDNKHNGVVVAINEMLGDNYYKPLVVVANNNGVLNVKYAKKEVKDKIVRVDNLINYIEKDIEETNLISRDSKSLMEKTANYLLTLDTPKQKNNWLDRFELKSQSNSDDDNVLKDKLCSYRTSESKRRNYPAYYIFTNDQLDKLLNNKPSTISELSSILEPVKVKIYGNDLLNIISSNK